MFVAISIENFSQIGSIITLSGLPACRGCGGGK
jgi:hypothetical protein